MVGEEKNKPDIPDGLKFFDLLTFLFANFCLLRGFFLLLYCMLFFYYFPFFAFFIRLVIHIRVFLSFFLFFFCHFCCGKRYVSCLTNQDNTLTHTQTGTNAHNDTLAHTPHTHSHWRAGDKRKKSPVKWNKMK